MVRSEFNDGAELFGFVAHASMPAAPPSSFGFQLCAGLSNQVDGQRRFCGTVLEAGKAFGDFCKDRVGRFQLFRRVSDLDAKVGEQVDASLLPLAASCILTDSLVKAVVISSNSRPFNWPAK
ncbi:MAG: hypothetical protein IPM06_19065 [Rhizobiales bacterium]|nr:hypothetical protein [Hyphomicrobiales bacterium]